MTAVTVTPARPADAARLAEFLVEGWSQTVVGHGTVYHPAELPALVARDGTGALVGALTYHIAHAALEIVTIDARPPRNGAGTALLVAAADLARRQGLARLWLVTTNDNLDALRFYQRRGLRLVAVRPGAVDQARALKPGIPLVGAYGIPIRDELELALDLRAGATG